MTAWDYIIVGGGSAGCVLANRLSAVPTRKVLLLEAGGEATGAMRIPLLGVAMGINNPKYDWRYRTEPDPTRNNRSELWPRGRALGGSSAINGMIYVRGDPDDYNHWAQLGARGWSWADVEPLFRRIENSELKGDAYGRDGELHIRQPRRAHPLSTKFVEASVALGVPLNNDYNAGSQEGACLLSLNSSGRLRDSTAEAFIRPVRHRTNLSVKTNCLVRRILFTGRRAVGVEIDAGSGSMSMMARGEVILCAGAINSPQLLMLSGIGPAAHLSDVGIPTIQDLPVGQNLIEHPALLIQALCNTRSYNLEMGLGHLIRHGYDYLAHGGGLLAAGVFQALAFIKTEPTLSHPDVQLHFSPCGVDKSGEVLKMLPENSYAIHPNVSRPRSRGAVLLRDADPRSAVRIQAKMLSDRYDLETLVAAARYCVKLCRGTVLGPLTSRIIDPANELVSADEWESYVRETAIGAYHPVGTCKMGMGDDAVVRPDLKVVGIDGLRVADASIAPTLISGNTNACAMMIGEKAAQLIAVG